MMTPLERAASNQWCFAYSSECVGTLLPTRMGSLFSETRHTALTFELKQHAELDAACAFAKQSGVEYAYALAGAPTEILETRRSSTVSIHGRRRC